MFVDTTVDRLSGHAGGTVRLRGWVRGVRRGGKVCFIELRDGSGVCQCVVEAAREQAFHAAAALTQEASIETTGTVRREPRAPGGWEVAVEELTLVGAAAEYPISRKAHGIEFLMANRHLWLRSSRPWTILRIRHTLVAACRGFLDAQGFTLVDTPILTPGAGEDAQALFPVDFFGRQAFLAQTGQLYLEAACMALGRVYCFGPTFRAEKSKTRRHLAEFWMVEPEMAFATLEDDMRLTEEMVCHAVRTVLERHAADLEALGRDLEPLRRVAAPFPRISYSEAVGLLRGADTQRKLQVELDRDRARLEALDAELRAADAELGLAPAGRRREALAQRRHELSEEIEDLRNDVENRPEHIRLAQSFEWGKDLGGSDETIVSRQFDRPVFVTHYPREAKAFYMKQDPDDPRVVRNMDLLAPEGYGEIVGGSQREDDPVAMAQRMTEMGLVPEDYGWYMDLRRFGSVPHAGFGLGIERTLVWICGLKHVREAIPFPRTMGRMTP